MRRKMLIKAAEATCDFAALARMSYSCHKQWKRWGDQALAPAPHRLADFTRRHRPSKPTAESRRFCAVHLTTGHSPCEWAISRVTNSGTTNHVRNLCCSRALETELQRAPLDSASEARCSAAQSMALLGFLPLHPKQTNQATNQRAAPKKKRDVPRDRGPT